MKKKAFKAALPYTLPICVGFLFLGMSYGFMMRSKGFSFVYPLCMSFFIYAGSMEFVTANLLLSAFNKCSKNFPTSSGGEMNCTSEHVCSRKSYDTERTLVLIVLM